MEEGGGHDGGEGADHLVDGCVDGESHEHGVGSGYGTEYIRCVEVVYIVGHAAGIAVAGLDDENLAAERHLFYGSMAHLVDRALLYLLVGGESAPHHIAVASHLGGHLGGAEGLEVSRESGLGDEASLSAQEFEKFFLASDYVVEEDVGYSGETCLSFVHICGQK